MNRNEIISAALEVLRSSDADKALISVKSTGRRMFSVYAQSRSTYSDSTECEMSIAVGRGDDCGSSCRTVASADDARAAAKSAVEEMAVPDGMEISIPDKTEPAELVHGCLDADTAAMHAYMDSLMAYIREKHPTIRIRVCDFSHFIEETVCCDLSGSTASDRYGYYQIDISVSAVDGDNSTCLFGTTVDMAALDTPPEKLVALDSTLSDAERMLLPKADKGPAENTVVFAPSSLTMVFYQLFQSQLGDFAMSSHSSRWADSMGTAVADSRLSVSIAPVDKTMCGMPWLDESGRAAKNTKIIESGVLCGTMLSEKCAGKLGLPAGNTSFCYSVQPGDKSLDELISDIRSGLLVTRLSGGTPTLAGDISMIAKGSFLIENGRITAPCEGVCISGNLAEALKNIDGLSSELCSTGSCILPYMRLSGLRLTGGGA